ncbi:MAG: DUF5683 domain-containing protein [Balneolaceae bacterium]|nr:DUF5683 domain-containing protein [Balneolaceae bacterium]
MKRVNILYLVLFFTVLTALQTVSAQDPLAIRDFSLLENRLSISGINTMQDTVQTGLEFPKPSSVLYKSLLIPGWGQVVNKQAWKVPIIYGLFAGVGAYTIYLDSQYKDYRAAFYNSHKGEDTDFRFGPTPERLQGVNPSQLQVNRNNFRNQRDFMFVVMGLAYGLNALDAYIFAHMRSFDVSDDLSARASVSPVLLAEARPGLRIKLSLF